MSSYGDDDFFSKVSESRLSADSDVTDGVGSAADEFLRARRESEQPEVSVDPSATEELTDESVRDDSSQEFSGSDGTTSSVSASDAEDLPVSDTTYDDSGSSSADHHDVTEASENTVSDSAVSDGAVSDSAVPEMSDVAEMYPDDRHGGSKEGKASASSESSSETVVSSKPLRATFSYDGGVTDIKRFPTDLYAVMQELLRTRAIQAHAHGLSDHERATLVRYRSHYRNAAVDEQVHGWVDMFMEQLTKPGLVTAFVMAMANVSPDGLEDETVEAASRYFGLHDPVSARVEDVYQQVQSTGVTMKRLEKLCQSQQIRLSELEIALSYLLAESTGKVSNHNTYPASMKLLTDTTLAARSRLRDQTKTQYTQDAYQKGR